MNKDIIIDWMVDNQNYLSELIYPLQQDYINQLNTNFDWKDQITKQYKQEVTELIIIEAGKALALPTIDMLELIEDIDITQYLDGEMCL